MSCSQPGYQPSSYSSLQCTLYFTGRSLNSSFLRFHPCLTTAFRVGLITRISDIGPTSFTMSSIVTYRIKSRHRTTDTTCKVTTRHEWTARGWIEQIRGNPFDGSQFRVTLFVQTRHGRE